MIILYKYMLTHTMEYKNMIAELVREKIEATNPLDILSFKDFNESSTEKLAVAKELSNLFKRGILKKISKGMYYKPKFSRFGELSPSDDEILMKYLELSMDKVGYISGVNVYRGMGLTTQISREYVIMNDTRQGIININNIQIKFIKTPIQIQKELSEEDITSLCILDALQDIKNIPACTPSNALKILTYRIKELSQEQKQKLYSFALFYKPMVRALLGLILDQIGEQKFAIQLKATLNPLTKFQVGLTSGLSGKQWNIV